MGLSVSPTATLKNLDELAVDHDWKIIMGVRQGSRATYLLSQLAEFHTISRL